MRLRFEVDYLSRNDAGAAGPDEEEAEELEGQARPSALWLCPPDPRTPIPSRWPRLPTLAATLHTSAGLPSGRSHAFEREQQYGDTCILCIGPRSEPQLGLCLLPLVVHNQDTRAGGSPSSRYCI